MKPRLNGGRRVYAIWGTRETEYRSALSKDDFPMPKFLRQEYGTIHISFPQSESQGSSPMR